MSFRIRFLPFLPGLDDSFIYTFNYASMHGLKWGQEMVSTFGPYGFLISAVDLDAFPRNQIVFDLLLAVGTGIVAATYARLVPGHSVPIQLTLTALLIYGTSLQQAEYRWLALIVLLVLIAVHQGRRHALIALAGAGVIAGFCFLIKFSLGFGALATVVCGCLLTSRWTTRFQSFGVVVAGATASFSAAWIAYAGTFSGISAYVTGAWQIASGYSSAMSLAPRTAIGTFSFLLWFALIASWVLLQQSRWSLVNLAVLVCPLFIAWKHSVVRQDGHVQILMRFGLLVTLIVLADVIHVVRWRRATAFLVLSVVLLAIPRYAAAPGGRGASLRTVGGDPVTFRGIKDVFSLTHLDARREALRRTSEAALRPDSLPPAFRKLVGTSGVDVYPWEISYVPANGLSWVTRPMPASYSSYTPALDEMNARFYRSEGRPEYVLWHMTPGEIQSIDRRHVFWDEPRTLFTLINGYELALAESQVMLLRARKIERFGPRNMIGAVTAPWNTWVSVPERPGVITVEAAIPQRAMARVVRFLFRESPVFLAVRFQSGDEASYRIVTGNVGQGLWVSPLPTSFQELRTLFAGGRARQVVSIQFRAGDLLCCVSPILLSWWHTPMLSPDGSSR